MKQLKKQLKRLRQVKLQQRKENKQKQESLNTASPQHRKLQQRKENKQEQESPPHHKLSTKISLVIQLKLAACNKG